jgi:hypothetical protein
MAYYRLYHLHGPRNEVESFHEFEAENDVGAIAVGETMRQMNPMELWQGHRKVRRWESLSHAS